MNHSKENLNIEKCEEIPKRDSRLTTLSNFRIQSNSSISAGSQLKSLGRHSKEEFENKKHQDASQDQEQLKSKGIDSFKM